MLMAYLFLLISIFQLFDAFEYNKIYNDNIVEFG